MRALCGAIIAAGALIGLGLVSIGLGLRYQNYQPSAGEPQWVKFSQLDTSLMLALVVCFSVLGIGVVTAFFGLAYHHHRRLHELQHGLQSFDRTVA